MKGILIIEASDKQISAVELQPMTPESAIKFDKNSQTAVTSWCRIDKTEDVKCLPKDEYDFEVGALITLMKMCRVDKVKKAVKETFFDVSENGVNEYEEKISALEEENKRLKQQVEKLEEENIRAVVMRDFLDERCDSLIKLIQRLKEDIDIDIIFCGGRVCGKQYKALVELFKKTPKEKVDAAYKEAYGDCIILCSSHPSTRDELLSLLEVSKYVIPSEDSFKIKPLTKREEMWNNILGASKCPPVEIKVAKQDITYFLRELQDKIPEARWNGSDCPLLEYTNPYWFKHDYIYFALFKKDDKGSLRMCYDDKLHSWINKPVIEYLPPMRWDLFLKGRKIVRITADNVDDFLKECEKNCDIKESEPFKDHLATKLVYTNYGFISVCKDPQMNKLVLHFMRPDDLVREQNKCSNGYEAKKIVDWEGVR